MRKALRCTQMHSDALRCTQAHSDALRCARALRCTQMRSDALKTHSDALRCHQMPSDAINGLPSLVRVGGPMGVNGPAEPTPMSRSSSDVD